MSIIKKEPLNPLQRAYLMGRNAAVPLGGIAMHDFREFRCQFSEPELKEIMLPLVKKHSVLRTYIDDVALEKHIYDEANLNINFHDYSQNTQAEADKQINELRQHSSQSQLPLEKSLWEMTLVQIPVQDCEDKATSILFTRFDGLIIDGYAISIILNELFNGEDKHKPIKMRQMPVSYFENLESDKSYWKEKLDTIEEVISLPWKQDLDRITSSSYKRQGFVIPETNWKSILALGAKQRLLPNSILTTALFEVLSLWTSDNTVLVSMPISNSILHSDLSNHSSFIALAYENSEQIGFIDKARALQKDVLEAMGHTSFSGVELGKMLLRQTGKLVSLPVAVTNGLSWGSSAYQNVEYMSGITQTPQLALDIRIHQTANNDIAIDFDYAEQALSDLLINEFLQTLEGYLIQLSEIDDSEKIALPSVDVKKTAEIALPWQDLKADSEQVQDYLTQIKQNLYDNHIENTALIYDDKAISYRELGINVAKVANKLSSLNIQRGDVVAICLAKSPEHIAITLACSLANIIWLPIDMDSPTERIQFMLNNCRADLMISDQDLGLGIKTLNIHDTLNDKNLSDTLVGDLVFDGEPGYYLYTSGSTGTPKCVVMNHLATANVVEETNKTWNLTRNDVMFSATPFHHDMSVYELFAAMSLGASLVVPTKEQAKSGMDWARLVETHKVSVWSSVPAIVDMLLVCADPRQLATLKLVSQGGDYVKPTVIDKLRRYLPHARLFSIGGPTETTIWNIWHEITAQDIDIIPYGSSFKFNRYYIMNDKGQHCPSLVSGTLCASGVNLANGYLKDGVINQTDYETLTTPEGQQVRVFKTSDRGFFREDGKIIFSGRKQGYLKIRGVRIASSEVELGMTKHPLVRDAIVMACTNPQYQTSEMVVTYVTEGEADISIAELRHFLKAKLPNSHIPSRWLAVDEFPLTRNKKVDRKRLKEMAEAQFYDIKLPTDVVVNTQSKAQAKPISSLETQVINAFCDVLGLSEESVTGDTEILSLGIRPKQLGLIAKHLSKNMNLDVNLYTLAKATNLTDVTDALSKMAVPSLDVVN